MNTMIHEIINYQSHIPIKLFYQRIGTVARHWHNSIEILFVLQGTMEVTVEDRTWVLKEDDLILINPNHIHETKSADCSLIVTQIRLAEFHLDWALPKDIQFDCNSAADGSAPRQYFQLKHYIATLLKNNISGGSFSQLSNYTCAIELIRELCLHFQRTDEARAPHSIKYLNRLKSILEYIHENYKEKITLQDIASRQFLTPTYLSAFFEKTMGVPLSAYITNVRLDHAISQLVSGETSIEEIAADNGFTSARAFASVFKKYYHMLPSEYRKQLKYVTAGGGKVTPKDRTGSDRPGIFPSSNAMDLLTPKQQNSYLVLERYDFLDRLAPYLKSQPDALPKREIAFDKKNFEKINGAAPSIKKWNNSFKCFCGVSRASELLLPPVREMIFRAQKEVGFEFIKFHGILDDDLMVCARGRDNTLVFNFIYVDMVIDFLLENHLKPMIQFSFMPSALAVSTRHTVFQKPVIISPPSSENEWCSLITNLTFHLLERYGADQVRQWIFTFWNETLNGLSFDFEDTETSLRLYRLTRQCVKDCDPGLKFASTSYSALTYPENNYNLFMEYCKKYDCIPDMYIFHFYPVVADDDAFNASARQWKAKDYTRSVALSRDPDIFDHFLENLEKAGIPAAHIYITEWNFSPSHREWLNDTCFSACYIVRNMLKNFNKAAGFCHWCLTDLHQELPMPDPLFHGGLGLFTRSGVPKPSYWAYLFLNRLYEDIIFQAEGICITRRDNNYAILLYHYYHFNNLYGHGISFDATAKNWQAAFADPCPVQISFDLDNLRDGAYILSCQYIHPQCGSAFEAWTDMGSPDLDSPEETALLKAKSCPSFYKKTVSVSNGTLQFSEYLHPHEIRLILLNYLCC